MVKELLLCEEMTNSYNEYIKDVHLLMGTYTVNATCRMKCFRLVILTLFLFYASFSCYDVSIHFDDCRFVLPVPTLYFIWLSFW